MDLGFDLLNLSGLREEAIQRLNTEGHVPWQTLDYLTIGYILGRNGIYAGEDHPVATKFHLEAVDGHLGKWAFLVGLLDPWGLAPAYPDIVSDVAMTMLGKTSLSPTIQKLLLKRWEDRGFAVDTEESP